ncbi:hypothetical protein U0070_007522 [Myodes glareolus]|uniref:Uncharacterized protein n=1 Tax=Myodes glareolus TaxID=447135 RepID=A0AAW0J1N1_MYOGA
MAVVTSSPVEGETVENYNDREARYCSYNLELERRQDAGIAVELRACYANILPSFLSDSNLATSMLFLRILLQSICYM